MGSKLNKYSSRVTGPKSQGASQAMLYGAGLTDEDMEKYKLPMPWGAYAPATKRGLGSAQIKADDVPGAGYHWYKLGALRIVPSSCSNL